VRRHAGLMVPGPAQAAGVAALADEGHVEAQRARYRERLEFLTGVLAAYGCPVALPEGGFYLWVPVPEGRWRDAWAMAEALAADGGLLVSPGDLYGERGAGHHELRHDDAGAERQCIGSGIRKRQNLPRHWQHRGVAEVEQSDCAEKDEQVAIQEDIAQAHWRVVVCSRLIPVASAR